MGWVQAAGASEWTSVDVEGTEHTFDGLTVATDHNVEVSASNAAGIRDGILPSTDSFTTLDNRPPHPVDGLAVTAGTYNETSISLGWTLDSNAGENRIVDSIVASVADSEGAEAAAPQELAG